MLLLSARNISKQYGERTLFTLPELQLFTGDRVALVGENGSGKTTLMSILAGALSPDEGLVERRCEMNYLRQFSEEDISADPHILSELGLSGKTGRDGLSGGEKTRLKIAGAISRGGTLLLADEPTANLDIAGQEWLARVLEGIPTFILISHDRDLLDRLCYKTVALHDGRVTVFNGNYSAYLNELGTSRERAYAEYEQYSRERARLEGAASESAQRAQKMRNAPSRMGNSEARLHRRSAAERSEKLHSNAKAVQSRIDRLEVKEKPRDLPRIKLDFNLTHPPENKMVVSARGLTFAYGDTVLFEKADFVLPNRRKTALCGPNGAGKTTLLNLITMTPHPDGSNVTLAPKAKLGYFHQDFGNLEPGRTVLQNAMRDCVQGESLTRLILARLLFRGDDVFKPVSVLSGGEKIKLSLAKLLVSDANVLVLDEPTNYLDIHSVEAVQALLSDFEGTLLFVSHDKAFVNGVADRLLLVENRKLRAFDGNLAALEKAATAPPPKTDRLLLEFRQAQLLSQIPSAGEADKERLEAEYHAVCAQLREL